MLWLPVNWKTTGTTCSYPWLSLMVFISVCLHEAVGSWIKQNEKRKHVAVRDLHCLVMTDGSV